MKRRKKEFRTWSGAAYRADEQLNQAERLDEGWEFKAVSYLGDTPNGGPMVMIVWAREVAEEQQ